MMTCPPVGEWRVGGEIGRLWSSLLWDSRPQPEPQPRQAGDLHESGLYREDFRRRTAPNAGSRAPQASAKEPSVLGARRRPRRRPAVEGTGERHVGAGRFPDVGTRVSPLRQRLAERAVALADAVLAQWTFPV